MTAPLMGAAFVGVACWVAPSRQRLVAAVAFAVVAVWSVALKGYTSIEEKDNVVRATIEVVEPLGAETHIMASVGGDQTVVARVDAHAPVSPGDDVELLVDRGYLHAFDLDNEDNLRFA